MISPSDIISYWQMCQEEGTSLQQGMNYRLNDDYSVILMSLRPDAPYADRVENEGRTLIYEGHDTPRRRGGPDPKQVDQELMTSVGKATQNGLFFEAAARYKRGGSPPELVKVYEKVRDGIWVYNGVFKLVDGWSELSAPRQVFKFKLQIVDVAPPQLTEVRDLAHTRVIPSRVKQEVWKRDKGRCVICAASDNLHFDHDIPYSKGGSSLVAENVRLLCARHNLEKRDRIE